jgi:hypothetical protein
MTLRDRSIHGKDENAGALRSTANGNERGGNRTHDLKLKRLLL